VLSRCAHWILRKLGWTLNVDLPEIDKFVAIAAPHTSNWDFPLGILAAKAINLKVHWLGKHSLFHWPYGWIFRAIGGISIRRDGGQNYMQQLTDLFDRSEHLVLALAPEGTRSRTDHWKTGFHAIARAANVPILMAYLDYGNKQVGIGGLFYPGDDIEADFARIREYYKDRRGKNPEKESLIQVRQKKT
jgi:1-acyl-sn-glycerol-3-phosphate acyltransferase